MSTRTIYSQPVIPLRSISGSRRRLTRHEAQGLLRRTAEAYGHTASQCRNEAQTCGLVTPDGFLQYCASSYWLADNCQCVDSSTGSSELNCLHCRGTGRK